MEWAQENGGWESGIMGKNNTGGICEWELRNGLVIGEKRGLGEISNIF